MSDIVQKIRNSEMILVGIGREWEGKSALREREKVIYAYKKLAFCLKDKNYYILTLNTQGLIYEGFSRSAPITAPCGDVNRFQCPAGCMKEIWLDLKTRICPYCGRELVANTTDAEVYVEEGYLPSWERYTSWLKQTINKQLLILELGMDFSFPSVGRWPFEKLAFYNLKSELWRVNQSFPQIPEEIMERSATHKADSIEFILQNLPGTDI